jgi:hypothetical protein
MTTVVTAQDIIYKSLRLLGVLASGEAPTAAEAQDSLYSLNSMIDSFSANPQFYYYSQDEKFTLTSAQRVYAMGNDTVSAASATSTATVATVTTTTPHGLETGNKITTTGATPSLYNVSAASITVTSATTFTYTVSGGGAAATVAPNYTSADFVTSRPIRIVGAFIRTTATNVDTPMGVITEQYWNNISDKNSATVTSTTPSKILYRPSMPFGQIFAYPTPSGTPELHIRCEKMISSYSGLTSTQYLPPGYQRLLELSLAVEIAPEYGSRAAPETVAYLKTSLDALMRTNLGKVLSSKIGGIPNSNVYSDTTIAGSQALNSTNQG